MELWGGVVVVILSAGIRLGDLWRVGGTFEGLGEHCDGCSGLLTTAVTDLCPPRALAPCLAVPRQRFLHRHVPADPTAAAAEPPLPPDWALLRATTASDVGSSSRAAGPVHSGTGGGQVPATAGLASFIGQHGLAPQGLGTRGSSQTSCHAGGSAGGLAAFVACAISVGPDTVAVLTVADEEPDKFAAPMWVGRGRGRGRGCGVAEGWEGVEALGGGGVLGQAGAAWRLAVWWWRRCLLGLGRQAGQRHVAWHGTAQRCLGFVPSCYTYKHASWCPRLQSVLTHPAACRPACRPACRRPAAALYLH